MTRRQSLIQIRVTAEEKAAIEKRAGDRPVSDYMRGLALGAVSSGSPEGVAPSGDKGPTTPADRIGPVASSTAPPRAPAPGTFMCPRDCNSSFRPTSPKMRCPACRRQVVPA